MEELRIDLDPLRVYGFNNRIYMDPTFRSDFYSDPVKVLSGHGFNLTLPISPKKVEPFTEEDTELLKQLAAIMKEKGLVKYETIEYSVSGNVQVPNLIVVLLVLVAVAVAVALWVI